MNKIKILVVEPIMDPYVTEIYNTLEEKQKIVDGLIQFIELEEDIDLICNEQGKEFNLEINKIIKNDVICGNFIICGQQNGDSISLTNNQIIKYKRLFKERYHTILKALLINRYRESKNLINVNLKGIHKLLSLLNSTNIFDDFNKEI